MRTYFVTKSFGTPVEHLEAAMRRLGALSFEPARRWPASVERRFSARSGAVTTVSRPERWLYRVDFLDAGPVGGRRAVGAAEGVSSFGATPWGAGGEDLPAMARPIPPRCKGKKTPAGTAPRLSALPRLDLRGGARMAEDAAFAAACAAVGAPPGVDPLNPAASSGGGPDGVRWCLREALALSPGYPVRTYTERRLRVWYPTEEAARAAQASLGWDLVIPGKEVEKK